MTNGEGEHRAGSEQAPVRQRWGRVWFGYRANAMMLWVGRRALWLGYFFVWWGALWFFVCAPGARRASVGYLDRVWGGRGRRGVLRRRWDTYRHLVTYGYLLLDRAVMLSGPGHGYEIVREGMEQLHAAAEAAREEGLVVLTAHFGNAEAAMPLLAGKMGKVLRERAIHVVMWQDLGDATERFHARTRRMMEGMEVISTTDPLRAGVKIMGALRAGGVVGMRADRRLGGKTVVVELLGEKVALPAGPFVATALTGAPVVSVYTCRLGYRRYACLIGVGGGWRRYGEECGGSREERVERAARDYARGLEEMIRKYPLQWGNFYDVWAG